jgi:hypothetical protein
VDQKAEGRVNVVALPHVATLRVRVSPEPVPKEGLLERAGSTLAKIHEFKPYLRPANAPSMADPLPMKEVVRSVHRGNKKAAFAATS